MAIMDLSLKTGEIVSILKREIEQFSLTLRPQTSKKVYRLVMESPECMVCNLISGVFAD